MIPLIEILALTCLVVIFIFWLLSDRPKRLKRNQSMQEILVEMQRLNDYFENMQKKKKKPKPKIKVEIIEEDKNAI